MHVMGKGLPTGTRAMIQVQHPGFQLFTVEACDGNNGRDRDEAGVVPSLHDTDLRLLPASIIFPSNLLIKWRLATDLIGPRVRAGTNGEYPWGRGEGGGPMNYGATVTRH